MKIEPIVIRVKDLSSIKNPVPDVIYEIVKIVKGRKRLIGFKFTGKKGFGKWRIIYNKLVG